VAIKGVTVVDLVDGSLLPDRTVVIAGNRIAMVGMSDEVRIPRGAELVEAANHYVIPGLWDMHVHSLNPVAGDTADRSIAAQDWHLPLFLAYGVTGVRNMNDGAVDVTLVLLAATDVDIPLGVPGLSLHEELATLVEAGLTPLEALRDATLDPARVLGLADSLGKVESGKLADLVLLDANPLEDIRNTRRIRAVVADGRLYRRADLDRLLAGVAGLNQPAEDGE
jgi:imidazolonepropionase-like amidohydrolase